MSEEKKAAAPNEIEWDAPGAYRRDVHVSNAADAIRRSLQSLGYDVDWDREPAFDLLSGDASIVVFSAQEQPGGPRVAVAVIRADSGNPQLAQLRRRGDEALADWIDAIPDSTG